MGSAYPRLDGWAEQREHEVGLPPVTQRSHEMHELSQVLLAVSVTTLEASTGSVGHSAQRRRADECR